MCKIVYKDPKVLLKKTFKHNPRKRIEETRINGLLKSIREHGFISIIMVGSDGAIGDGNRRAYCAAQLGIKRVPCLVHQSLTACELFRLLNDKKSSHAINGPEALESFVLAGFNFSVVPSSFEHDIRLALKTCSPSTIKLMVELGIGANFVHVVRGFLTWMSNHAADLGDESRKLSPKARKWIRTDENGEFLETESAVLKLMQNGQRTHVRALQTMANNPDAKYPYWECINDMAKAIDQ